MNLEFLLGTILLLIGTVATGFPSKKTPLNRLINIEIAAIGLLFITLAFDETIAIMTFVAVTAVTTFVFVKLIQRSEAK